MDRSWILPDYSREFGAAVETSNEEVAAVSLVEGLQLLVQDAGWLASTLTGSIVRIMNKEPEEEGWSRGGVKMDKKRR